VHKPAERSIQAAQWHKMYGARWRKYRLVFLAANPLCVDPYQDHGKRPVMATVVDHIRAHKGDYGLFWLASNHAALCVPCNSKKAALEEGAFGR
jgi:5-methylcytosine-specific restriction protein A